MWHTPWVEQRQGKNVSKMSSLCRLCRVFVLLFNHCARLSGWWRNERLASKLNAHAPTNPPANFETTVFKLHVTAVYMDHRVPFCPYVGLDNVWGGDGWMRVWVRQCRLAYCGFGSATWNGTESGDVAWWMMCSSVSRSRSSCSTGARPGGDSTWLE